MAGGHQSPQTGQEEMRQIQQQELALALGLGGGGTWKTTLATALHLCPCRDTDIYDDVEINGRCTELLPYPFTGQ